MIVALLALLLAPQADQYESHVIAVEETNMGQPLRGSDYRLIAEAARRPEMRGANLACFNIYVFDQRGVRTVAFVEARQREIVRETEAGTEIVWLPLDPHCRSISFQMGRDGHVVRVIHTRH